MTHQLGAGQGAVLVENSEVEVENGVPDNEHESCHLRNGWLSCCHGNGRSFTQCAMQSGETLVASLCDTLKTFSSSFWFPSIEVLIP